MRTTFFRKQSRALERLLRATTFSDESGEVCTPSCAVEARTERIRQQAYRNGLMR
jgi:hypothetical protein